MQCQSGSSLLPVAAAAAATLGVALLLVIRNRANKVGLGPSNVRKVGQPSHFHIRTSNAQLSCKFFAAFGLVEISWSGPYILLSCPTPKNGNNRGRHQPYILLEEIPPSENPTSCLGNASDVGLSRLCLGVEDVYKMVRRLKKKRNMIPISTPVCGRKKTDGEGGTFEPLVVVAAYRDRASGVLLELVSSPSWTARLTTTVAQLVGALKMPVFLRANVNVSNYEKGLAAFNALGYTDISRRCSQVENNLFNALQIPEPAIAKEMAMIRTNDLESPYSIELIEWEEHDFSQASVSSGERKDPMRLAITVKDLPRDLDRILFTTSAENDNKPPWTLLRNPKLVHDLPNPLGRAIVATIISDQDDLEVDVIAYEPSIHNVSEQASSPENKVVLITGCDSGFGRSLACTMSLLGFSVVAACLTKEGAEYLSQVVARSVVADFATTKGIQSVVSEVADTLKGKRLWAIVNNAGVCYPGNVEWQKPEIYQRTMQVNFHAPVSIIHGLLQHLKLCPGSRILQVSSFGAFLPLPSNSAYCSSKRALEAYSDSLRCELQPYDCHVTVVQPAAMKTSFSLSYWESWYNGYQEAPIERRTSINSDKVEKFVAKCSKQMQDTTEDPDLAITTMVKALLETRPPTRITAGISADLLLKPLSCLPDMVRDKILWRWMNFDEAHVPVEG